MATIALICEGVSEITPKMKPKKKQHNLMLKTEEVLMKL